MGRTCDARVAGAIKVERADCLAGTVTAEIDSGSQWSTLELVLISGAGALVAGAAGVLVGAYLR